VDDFGVDRLFGDDGDDTIYLVQDNAADVVMGGTGEDTLVLSDAKGPTHIDLAAGTITHADLPSDRFEGIEIFEAGSGIEYFDLSGLFSAGSRTTVETVLQIRNFGADDKLVLSDDRHLALSDLQAMRAKRDLTEDKSDFELRISVFDPETAAEKHGRPGFRHETEDALMIRQVDLRHEHDTGETEIELWITGELDQNETHGLTS
jgi:hypothetical protein